MTVDYVRYFVTFLVYIIETKIQFLMTVPKLKNYATNLVCKLLSKSHKSWECGLIYSLPSDNSTYGKLKRPKTTFVNEKVRWRVNNSFLAS